MPDRGTVQTSGLTLEQPPDQSANCGGFNSSLSVDAVTLDNPLAPGASVDVVFRLGVVQGGAFRFYINIEALPDAGPFPSPTTLPGL